MVKRTPATLTAKIFFVAVAGDFGYGGEVEEGGVVDEDVKAAGVVDDGGDAVVDGLLVGDIHLQGVCGGANLCGGLAGAGQVFVGDGDLCAFFGEGARQDEADAAAGAGDECGFAGQPVAHGTGGRAAPVSSKRCSF